MVERDGDEREGKDIRRMNQTVLPWRFMSAVFWSIAMWRLIERHESSARVGIESLVGLVLLLLFLLGWRVRYRAAASSDRLHVMRRLTTAEFLVCALSVIASVALVTLKA